MGTMVPEEKAAELTAREVEAVFNVFQHENLTSAEVETMNLWCKTQCAAAVGLAAALIAPCVTGGALAPPVLAGCGSALLTVVSTCSPCPDIACFVAVRLA